MSYKMLMYLGIFMSLVFLVYMIVPKKIRYLVLLVGSYLLYFLCSSYLIVFLLITTASIYFLAKWIDQKNDEFKQKKETLDKEARKTLKAQINKKKRRIVSLGIIINLIILLVLKYFNFFGGTFNSLLSILNIDVQIPLLKIMMPLGISFYTLQALSYLIDVYRGKCFAEKNIAKVALFVGYFPQVLEGPIGRYDQLADQLAVGHDFNYENFTRGLQLVLWGLIKKIVIADRINIIVAGVFSQYQEYSGLIIVLAIILYTFQIYAEFSGIIDMVSGVSEMFGIRLAKNFERPFFSKNVNEFWRRWHISLGAWLRDYIFYPISFSRFIQKLSKKLKGHLNNFFESFIPVAIALLFVWLCNGLWHGASWKYIFYGLYYYIIMMLGQIFGYYFKKIFKKEPSEKSKKWISAIQIFRTFIIVNIGMLIFRADTIKIAWDMLMSIPTGGIVNIVKSQLIDQYDLILIFIGIAILLVVDVLQERGMEIRAYIAKKPLVLRWTIYFIGIFGLIIFGAYGFGYMPVDPIYGQF